MTVGLVGDVVFKEIYSDGSDGTDLQRIPRIDETGQ